MVFNLAMQYVGQTEIAEEITQDVFVKVYFKMNQFREEAGLKTWIYRITVNACLDHLKAQKADKRSLLQRILPLDAFPGFEIADGKSYSLWIEQKESVRNILQAIHSLPPQQKTVILLLRFEHLTQQQTAQVMHCSVKAVESLYQRAKKNLEKKLNSHEGDRK